ncbi:MAG TPA: tetratricopeptide repeat protein [Thermoanaerobaculia bacterium]|nr:tetratricopeptide repeat protein [Thermoanaerobaculia bacterium]
MLNKVLWTLDNETDGTAFERLCTDLLSRTGYADILPVGGKKDRGRDAETDRRQVPIVLAPSGERTFFQFSLADRWEQKLKDELAKVKRNKHDIDAFLFVTTASVTGTTRDRLSKWVKEQYGWRLEIRDREWLRLQLEEAHPDLAERHLGVPQAHHKTPAPSLELPPLISKSVAAELFNAGKYGPAAVALSEWLTGHPEDAAAWRALAACHYQQHHYADALAAIHEALRLQPRDIHTMRTHACILVEKGIREHARASILLGRDIFEDIARSSQTWSDAYNLGNALIELDDVAGARAAYLEAVSRDAEHAEVWKNLGSANERLGDQEEALRCYEHALSLKPDLPEALFAKATLLIRRDEPGAGAATIERIFATDATARTHWDAAWWWLAEAYRRNEQPLDALRVLGRALAQFPSNERLLDMKAHLLTEHWSLHPDLQREAEKFFAFRAELAPDDFRPIESLGRIYLATGRADAAWRLIEDYLGDPDAIVALRALGDLDADRIKALRFARRYSRFREQKPLDTYVTGLRDNGLSLTDSQTAQLYWTFLDPFADGLMEAESISTRDESAYVALAEHHAPRIRAALARWCEGVSVELLPPPQESQIEVLTVLIAVCPEIALRECSSQTGFVAGFLSFTIDPATVEIPNAVIELPGATIEDVIVALNRRTHIFPDPPPTSSA